MDVIVKARGYSVEVDGFVIETFDTQAEADAAARAILEYQGYLDMRGPANGDDSENTYASYD